FIDTIRRMDEPGAEALTVPSAGTHIIVNKDMGIPEGKGVLISNAPNGSVAFISRFERGVLIGTTEEPMEHGEISEDPRTTEEHVAYLLDLANDTLESDAKLTRDDVAAVWTGIRPLVRDPKADPSDTKSLSRNHVVTTSDAGLVTIGGGKWTTFAEMGRDAIDAALAAGAIKESVEELPPLKIIGAHGYAEDLPAVLEQAYSLPPDVAKHLAESYGDRAPDVLAVTTHGHRERLAKAHPYIEAEVIYACRHEYACTPTDVLARRTRLAFVDAAAADAALPRVAQLMGRELGWDSAKVQAEIDSTRKTGLSSAEVT
ncbi:MAG: FAD-dependent oxidoreductase, partial [Myxococcota bacterium]